MSAIGTISDQLQRAIRERDAQTGTGDGFTFWRGYVAGLAYAFDQLQGGELEQTVVELGIEWPTASHSGNLS